MMWNMDRIWVENGHVMQHLQRVEEVGDVGHQIGWVILMMIIALGIWISGMYAIAAVFCSGFLVAEEFNLKSDLTFIIVTIIVSIVGATALGSMCYGFVTAMIKSVAEYHSWAEHTIITDLGNIVLI